MSRKTKQFRILWAVDPFEAESETRSHVLSTLKLFTQGHSVTVEPTYVLSPSEFDLSFKLTAPWNEKYKKNAKEILQQRVNKARLKSLLPPRVLVQRQPSLEQSVRTLLSHATLSKMNLIAVGTHARKGIFRVFLGSFAETLLLYSQIPLLIVGPHAASKKMSHILFATDLGPSSSILFEKVLELAERLNAKVTLFHVISHPVEPVLQSGVYLFSGGWVDWPEFLSKEEDEKRKIADRYAAIAVKRKIQIEIIIDSSHTSVSSLILKTAEKKKAHLIAMAAESGEISATLIGSTTRQVVREAHCPTWVMRY